MTDIEKQISELTNLVQSLTTEVQTLKKMIPQPKKSCEGKTAKGLPCGNKCLEGERYCRMHLNKPEPVPKPPRVPKKTKKKKVQPEHTCEKDPSVPCNLCKSHGDVMDPKMPEEQFECTDSQLVENLRKLLNREKANDEEPSTSKSWADMDDDDELPRMPSSLIETQV